MTHPILNLADVELRPWGHGVNLPGAGAAPERYEARIGAISGPLGAQKLGYGLTVLHPGKSAFPFHNHTVNEEMFFVIEGEGEVRIGAARHPIRAGDVIACPPGGPETAHQIVNTSSRDLRFLGVSTRQYPEVAQYPDSKKVGVLVEIPPGADGKPHTMRFLTRQGESLEYWEGE
jgi:uncharacterized cupin superfamily protein